jgi:hypothetical protein
MRLKQRNERVNRGFDVTRQEQPVSKFLLFKLLTVLFTITGQLKLIFSVHRTAIITGACYEVQQRPVSYFVLNISLT